MNTLVRENRSSNGDRQARPSNSSPRPPPFSKTPTAIRWKWKCPGVSKENLEMWVENNELTIVGRRSMPIQSRARSLHRESRTENFRRSFELDPSIDAGKISAKIEQGVVTLTLPKAEQVKPRKIAVA